jgi:hypothetical protein
VGVLVTLKDVQPIPFTVYIMKMWLDDLRDPAHFGRIGWVWVKTVDDAIELLKTGNVTVASLDHDLGIWSSLGFEDHREITGYTLVCWMEEHDCFPPDGCFVHSQNPTGAGRMRAVLQRYGKYNTY